MSEQKRMLGLQDRCDRCGIAVQAFARVIVGEGLSFDLCGHHLNEHEPKLLELGYEVIDERWAINEKPSPSANAEYVDDEDDDEEHICRGEW